MAIHYDVAFGVKGRTVREVAEAVCGTIDSTLSEHESSYIGTYWFGKVGDVAIQVSPALDPEGDYFINEVVGCDVMIRLDGELADSLRESISRSVWGAVQVFYDAYEYG